jgi:3D (Asp-Asp-Asp) domain-containing protein
MKTAAVLLLLCLAAAPAVAQKKTLTNVRVTFYCRHCDGSGQTATGSRFSSAGVAVDPRIIPLGSRVTIPGYGTRIADDTGGAIKGRRIDVRLGSRGNCARLGVQRKTVTFTRPKKRKVN